MPVACMPACLVEGSQVCAASLECSTRTLLTDTVPYRTSVLLCGFSPSYFLCLYVSDSKCSTTVRLRVVARYSTRYG